MKLKQNIHIIIAVMQSGKWVQKHFLYRARRILSAQSLASWNKSIWLGVPHGSVVRAVLNSKRVTIVCILVGTKVVPRGIYMHISCVWLSMVLHLLPQLKNMHVQVDRKLYNLFILKPLLSCLVLPLSCICWR